MTTTLRDSSRVLEFLEKIAEAAFIAGYGGVDPMASYKAWERYKLHPNFNCTIEDALRAIGGVQETSAGPPA